MSKARFRNITPESLVYEILELISFSTEVSPKLFHQCRRTSYDMYMKTVRYVLTRNYTYYDRTKAHHLDNIQALTLVGNGASKSLRLTEPAYLEKLMLMADENIYKRYQMNAYDKYQDTFNKASIERNHRLAELCLNLHSVEIKDCLDLEQSTDKPRNLFINIRMIKAYYPSEATNQGRCYGLLVLGGKCYAAYIFNSIKSHWTQQSELRNKKMMQRAVFDHFKPLSDNNPGYLDHMLIFGKDLAMARELLERKDKSVQPDNYMRMDATFENYHFIPYDKREEMLRLLQIPNLQKKLKKLTFGEKTKVSQTIDCDGITEDHEYLLFAFDFNLTRIWRLKHNAEYYQDKKFVIFAYRWQQEFLEEYCGEKVRILTISFEKLISNFS